LIFKAFFFSDPATSTGRASDFQFDLVRVDAQLRPEPEAHRASHVRAQR